MKPSNSNRFAFSLLRLFSENIVRSIFTIPLFFCLWLVNPDPEVFLPGAIATIIGIVWAWGTGSVHESETIARVVSSKQFMSGKNIDEEQKSSQEESVKSQENSNKKDKEKMLEYLQYLRQSGIITERQYKYSPFSKQDEE